MKVSDLIEALSQYEGDAMVKVKDGDQFFAVKEVISTFDFLPIPEKHAPKIGVLIQ